jgi:hypothetical protein
MTFISYQAALKGIERFQSQHDLDRTNQYRFELQDDGRCSVRVYSCCGTFLGYV